MNIFFLHNSPELCAKDLVDKHIVKMPLESAQMLSTAHRLLDGKQGLYVVPGKFKKNGQPKTKKSWLLPGESDSNPSTLYKVAHANHPSTVWTMKSAQNYCWHLELFKQMLKEYTRRYGKVHRCAKLLPELSKIPKNIPMGPSFTPPTPAMPDLYKCGVQTSVIDVMSSYRNYYAGEKWRFAKWKNMEVPGWFVPHMEHVWPNERFNERVIAVNKLSKKKTPPAHPLIMSKAIELSQ